MHVRDPRLSAGEEPARKQAIAAFDFFSRVLPNGTEHLLLDEQLVPVRLDGTVLAPSAGQPSDGSVYRPIAARDLVFRLVIESGLRLRAWLRRGNQLGQIAEELRQSPLRHGLRGCCELTPAPALA